MGTVDGFFEEGLTSSDPDVGIREGFSFIEWKDDKKAGCCYNAAGGLRTGILLVLMVFATIVVILLFCYFLNPAVQMDPKQQPVQQMPVQSSHSEPPMSAQNSTSTIPRSESGTSPGFTREVAARASGAASTEGSPATEESYHEAAADAERNPLARKLKDLRR